MKKAVAVLLTGCLTFQALMGSVVSVHGSVSSDVAAISQTSEDGQDLSQEDTVPEEDPAASPSPEVPISDAPETEASDQPAADQTDPEGVSPSTTVPDVSDTPDVSEVSGSDTIPDISDVPQTIAVQEEDEDIQTASSLAGEEAHDDSESPEESAALEVDVISGLPFEFEDGTSVTVTITQNDKEIDKKTAAVAGKNPTSSLVHFALPEGFYQVTLEAEQFGDYVQDVELKNHQTSRLQVCTAYSISDSEKTQRGWLRLGDVNSDGMINTKDTRLILAAIRGRSSDDNYNTDLNRDGITDITDLQYHIQSRDAEQLSTVEILAIPLETEHDEGTSVEGNLDSLLHDTGSVTLSPVGTGDVKTISEEHPVGLSFTLAKDDESAPSMGGMTIQAPAEPNEDGTVSSDIQKGEVLVEYVNADKKTVTGSIAIGESTVASIMPASFLSAVAGFGVQPVNNVTPLSGATVKVEPDGSLALDFGGQIAVKKVSIKITSTRKQQPLVEISRVEFVNDMESRIPAPTMNKPELHAPECAAEELTVSWTAQTNITGYELEVSGPVKKSSENQTQIIRVAGTQCRVISINDKPIKNYAEYTLRVRSVNGEWKSPWSDTKKAVPAPTAKPAAPDNVSLKGGYLSIQVSWKDMDDAAGYMVYYKEEGAKSFQPVIKGFSEAKDTVKDTGRTDIVTANSYNITGLIDGVDYEVYVKSWNSHGWGPASLSSVGRTASATPPQLPNYMAINTSQGAGKLTANITSATMGASSKTKMVASPLDEGKANSALGVVDDNFASYWSKDDWDDGATYPPHIPGNMFDKGICITLNKNYEMNYLTFAAADQKAALDRVSVYYWNTKSSNYTKVGAKIIEKRDANNKPFYIVRFDEMINANKVLLYLGRSWGNTVTMMVGEIRFHRYDSIETEIMGLYKDEMHTTLRSDVTAKTIQDLETKLDSRKDCGERHPLYAELKLELKTAREILENKSLAASYEVINTITAKKDDHLGFGGLNAWQPLGKSAYAGETLIVYVGHNYKRTGESAELELVFTQHHAESSALSKTVRLKIGRNEITVPAVSDKKFEKGGQLYIAYTGNNAADKYAVRISGASDIPVLNVYGKTGSARTAAIKQYISDLETHVKNLETKHQTVHTGTKNVDFAYDAQNCILNATDIMMENMMYSVPATQLLAGIGSASDKTAKLDTALKAMEDTMTLFYQHKGLSSSAGSSRGNNALPSQHLNIRYMRMFAGAFMYASGNHIGIEWNETKMAGSAGSIESFGWGIGHEIGHDINQGTYAIAEVTNNYFAQLMTKTDSSAETTRFKYPDVYEKVTSGTIGRSPNVGIQLALYWQLHLAYDNCKNEHHTYSNYEDQFHNLFFARVDTYSRNPDKAPQAGLKLVKDIDQNLMRLSCAAANKNILPFFERWGMIPDDDTRAYAAKYGEPEAKALYYVNDTARNYRVDHSSEEGNVTGSEAIENVALSKSSNKITLTITPKAASRDVILGYEITRSMISNGEPGEKVVGFVEAKGAASTTFTDTITSINNRVMTYQVKAVDKYLNYSLAAQAGSVKIQTDGELSKANWSVATNMTSEDDVAIAADKNDPDSGFDKDQEEKKVNSIERIIDNDETTEEHPAVIYQGTSSGTAVITIDMHKTEQVTSLKYKGSDLTALDIEVSNDNTQWTTVKKHYAGCTDTSHAFHTVWFDSVRDAARSSWIGTYDARYVRMTIHQAGPVTIDEIDLCGPTGDNLEFLSAGDGKPAIGKLADNYIYDKKTQAAIPKGSLVFTGTYKGNPAYNVVILYDSKGNVIGAHNGEVNAEQIIFADVPDKGNLGETSSGTWVYYVEPGNWDEETLQELGSIRGELYRVDVANTLEGERIVSDTLPVEIPEHLENITLTQTKNGN